MIGKTALYDKDYVYCTDCLYGGRETDTCTAPAGVLKSCTEIIDTLPHWKDNPNRKDSRTWEPL